MKERTERIARHSTAAAVAAAFLLAFAGVALSQVVSAPEGHGGTTSTGTETGGTTTGGPGQGNGQKVQICHFTHSKSHPAHTIWVAKAAEQSFLARGDHKGKCTEAEMKPKTSTTTTTSTTSSSKHKPKHKTDSSSSGKGHGGGGKGK